MADYDLDNKGSGFNLEDDEDFGSMLDRVGASSEDNDGDEGAALESESSPKVEVAPEPTPEPEPEVEDEDQVEEFEEEDEVEEVVAPPPATRVRRPSMGTPVPGPGPARQPAATRKAVSEPRPATPKGRVHIPSEAEQVSDTARIIAILDAYRKLNDKEKAVTIQFVSNSDLEEADDATLVVKVLNADPILMPTMSALCTAYECEAVERAFYAMSLETRTLHNLGALVTVFTGDVYDEAQTNLDYSREVVTAIAGLPTSAVSFVRATESVLAAARLETDG